MIQSVRWVKLTRTFSNPDSHFLWRQVLKKLVKVFVNNKSAFQRSPLPVKAVGLREDAPCRKHSHFFGGGTVQTKQIGTIVQCSLPLYTHTQTHTVRTLTPSLLLQ